VCVTLLPVPWQPWPTGLRVQHIRDALGDGAGLLDQLTAVVNLLAQGRACASVMPVLAGAGLVACPSPLVGSDPLPLGSFSAALREPGLLCPAERKRPCIAFGPGLAAVLLPTIPWSSAVLQEARDKFPALARWATWCYRQASNLQFGDTVLQSSSGVQQGDPLGPLLFA
ncbi:unnamed protein product, partial [Durusdinium trenchii]